jgi:hypothetical protein
MDNCFYYAGCISIIFLILKSIEAKFINKTPIDFKKLIRETVLVCFCSIVGIYGCNNYANIPNISNNIKKADVFVDKPGF